MGENYGGGETVWSKTRKWIVYFMLITLLFAFYPDQKGYAATFDIDAPAAILVEASTGKILFEKNADAARAPASMSKMMVEYLVLEAIHHGQLSWDQTITTTEWAYFHGQLPVSSRVFLNIGEQRTVEELFIGMAVYSGNDATVALAEAVAGSEAAFVRMMNDKARELGMVNTHFVNTTGLPNEMLGNYIPAGSPDDENLMSARDTAILAHALLRDYPEITDFSSIPERRNYLNVDLINFNWMLEGHPQIDAQSYTYPGLDGLKTGFTNLAGYCFTGTAERDGMRLISVVMGTESIAERFSQTRQLLDYGFANFELVNLVQAGEKLEEETWTVSRGKEKEVGIQIGEGIRTVIHKDEQDLYSVDFTLDASLLDDQERLIAPLEQGQVIGTVSVNYSGSLPNDYLQGTGSTAVVITTDAVEKAGWFRLFMRSIGDFFSGVFSSISNGIKGWFS
jgi:D-alanyl-D-alanine carboxypeptidase (penicillin-binding protein 5/6)